MQNISLRPEVERQERINGVTPASKSILLVASVDQVFDIFEQPGHLMSFHPFCRENYATVWEEAARQDVLTYLNGLTYVRDFVSWHPPVGFDLLIGEQDQRQSLVGWRLKPITDITSQLTITVYPHLLRDLPTVVAYPLHRLWLRPHLEDYLKSVVAGLQFHLITKGVTPRKAFGSHPWFS